MKFRSYILSFFLLSLMMNLYAAEANIMINSHLSSDYEVRCTNKFKSNNPSEDTSFQLSQLCNQTVVKSQYMTSIVYNNKIGFSGRVYLDVFKANQPIATCRVNYSIGPRKEEGGFVEKSKFVQPKEGEACQCQFKNAQEQNKLGCIISIQNSTMSSMISLTN